MSVDPILQKVYESMPRTVPGSKKYTFGVIQKTDIPFKKNPRILELGCGKGFAAIVFAKAFSCYVLSTDVNEANIRLLEERVKKETALMGKIETKVIDTFYDAEGMEELGKFDVIWSEGYLGQLGLTKCLQHWKPALNPGGYAIVSEIVLLSKPHSIIEKYLKTAFPTIGSVDEVKQRIIDAGYEVINMILAGKEAWLEEYYQPMKQAIDKLKPTVENNTPAMDLLKNLEEEIILYMNSKESYSYVYFICKVK